jgi:MOSC domain-containing protein YiiM
MSAHTGRVHSVNLAFPSAKEPWTGGDGKTGIDKREAPGRIKLEGNAVVGDFIGDKKNHGGYDQAVYAYAYEDLQWWESNLGITISNGRFGENLTTQGIDVTQAVIGERWNIGTAVLEVSQPRIPCRTFAGFWNRPHLIKEFTAAARPGAYLRIVQEGAIQGGDEIVINDRPSHGITILDLFVAKAGERSRISEILLVPQLSTSYREWASNISRSNGEN